MPKKFFERGETKMKELIEIKSFNKEVKIYISDDKKIKSENPNRIINYEHSQRFSMENFCEKYKQRYLELRDLRCEVYFIEELNNEVNYDFNKYYCHSATSETIKINQIGWIGIEEIGCDNPIYNIFVLKDLYEEYFENCQKIKLILKEGKQIFNLK